MLFNENLEKSARNRMLITYGKQCDLEKLRKTVNALILPDMTVSYPGHMPLDEVISVSHFFP